MDKNRGRGSRGRGSRGRVSRGRGTGRGRVGGDRGGVWCFRITIELEYHASSGRCFLLPNDTHGKSPDVQNETNYKYIYSERGGEIRLFIWIALIERVVYQMLIVP